MVVATTHDQTARSENASAVRSDHGKHWTAAEAARLYQMPLNDLLFRAQTVHRAHFEIGRASCRERVSSKV